MYLGSQLREPGEFVELCSDGTLPPIVMNMHLKVVYIRK